MGWTVYNSDGKILQSAELGDNAVTSAKIADGAILNADINASAAIAKTKLASLDVVNADVNASAAVALSKLATTTVSRALVSDGSGVISPSAVTSTEIGYLDGVTSAIQTQIDAAGGLRGIVVLHPQGIDDTTNGALGVIAPNPWVGCRPTTAGNNGSAYFTGAVPSDFTTLNSAKLVCLGVEGSTNLRLGTNTCKIAAHSEINTTHSNSMTAATYAITTNEIMHIDISSLFTNLAANDSFAFNIRRNGDHGDDTVTTFYIYSAILEYS